MYRASLGVLAFVSGQAFCLGLTFLKVMPVE
jgi:hypothetical protein